MTPLPGLKQTKKKVKKLKPSENEKAKTRVQTAIRRKPKVQNENQCVERDGNIRNIITVNPRMVGKNDSNTESQEIANYDFEGRKFHKVLNGYMKQLSESSVDTHNSISDTLPHYKTRRDGECQGVSKLIEAYQRSKEYYNNGRPRIGEKKILVINLNRSNPQVYTQTSIKPQDQDSRESNYTASTKSALSRYTSNVNSTSTKSVPSGYASSSANLTSPSLNSKEEWLCEDCSQNIQPENKSFPQNSDTRGNNEQLVTSNEESEISCDKCKDIRISSPYDVYRCEYCNRLVSLTHQKLSTNHEQRLLRVKDEQISSSQNQLFPLKGAQENLGSISSRFKLRKDIGNLTTMKDLLNKRAGQAKYFPPRQEVGTQMSNTVRAIYYGTGLKIPRLLEIKTGTEDNSTQTKETQEEKGTNTLSKDEQERIENSTQTASPCDKETCTVQPIQFDIATQNDIERTEWKVITKAKKKIKKERKVEDNSINIPPNSPKNAKIPPDNSRIPSQNSIMKPKDTILKKADDLTVDGNILTMSPSEVLLVMKKYVDSLKYFEERKLIPYIPSEERELKLYELNEQIPGPSNNAKESCLSDNRDQEIPDYFCEVNDRCYCEDVKMELSHSEVTLFNEEVKRVEEIIIGAKIG
uniref:Uncharacterized protein n=1 Tax=Cacopsylla melanoneura TaxID=428564 RepID=A0A8D9AQP6_9HEMI